VAVSLLVLPFYQVATVASLASAKKSVLRGRYKLKMSNLLCSIFNTVFNIQYAASNDFQDVSWMKK